MLDPDQLSELEGSPVAATDGEEIGSVAEAFLNAADDRPAWLAVDTGEGRVLAPLDGARLDGETVVVDHPANLILSAPSIPEGGTLAPQQETALYEHYGLHDSALREDTGRSSGLPDAG